MSPDPAYWPGPDMNDVDRATHPLTVAKVVSRFFLGALMCMLAVFGVRLAWVALFNVDPRIVEARDAAWVAARREELAVIDSGIAATKANIDFLREDDAKRWIWKHKHEIELANERLVILMSRRGEIQVELAETMAREGK